MYLPPFIMAILNNSIAYKNITESYYYGYYDWRVFFILEDCRVFFILDVGIEEALYTEVSSFQGLEMMVFHYIQRCLFQKVEIEVFHCTHFQIVLMGVILGAHLRSDYHQILPQVIAESIHSYLQSIK